MRKVIAISGEITNKLYPRILDKRLKHEQTVNKIAEIAYETVSLFQKLNTGTSHLGWIDLTTKQQAGVVKGVQEIVSNPDSTPEILHDRWVQKRRKAGWVYAEAKDVKTKKHPELLPYKNLNKLRIKSDGLFHVIVKYLILNG